MYIRSKVLNPHDLHNIVKKVSREHGYTLTAQTEPVSKTRMRFKVGSVSGARGSRRSWSGRRGPWACWHAFRDVLAEVFDRDPDATVTTAFATYRGKADFLAKYPWTDHHNVESFESTVHFSELCECRNDPRREEAEAAMIPQIPLRACQHLDDPEALR